MCKTKIGESDKEFIYRIRNKGKLPVICGLRVKHSERILVLEHVNSGEEYIVKYDQCLEKLCVGMYVY